MSSEKKQVKQILSAIQEIGSHETKPYETKATVTRVEDGKAYIHIDGGVTETPATMAVTAKAGDTVTVTVKNSGVTITGNTTDPPDNAKGDVMKLSRVVETMKDTADKSSVEIEKLTQYFWHDDQGAHVSTEEGSTSGPNALLTAAGLHVRDGDTDLASFLREGATIGSTAFLHTVIDSDSLDVRDGSDAVVATFSANNAQIGKNDTWHITMGSNGYTIYEGTTARYRITSFTDTDPAEAGTLMRSGNSHLRMYTSETTGSHTELLTTATNDTAIASMRATEVNYSTEQTKAAEVSKTWFGVTGDGDYDDSSSLDLSFGAEGGHHVFGVDNAGNMQADGAITAGGGISAKGRVTAGSASTYKFLAGGASDMAYIDCRDASNTQKNAIWIKANGQTIFYGAINVSGINFRGTTLMKRTTVTLTFTAKKGTGTTGNVSVGTIQNYICAGIVQILSNHPNLLQLGQYFISNNTLYLTAYNRTTSDQSATYTVSLLWLHYGMY